MRAVRNVGRTVAGEHNDTQIRESALGILRLRKLYVDISPPSSTSVTRARSSGPVEASTSCATSPLAHSHLKSFGFQKAGKTLPLERIISTMRATKFDIICLKKENSRSDVVGIHCLTYSRIIRGTCVGR